MTGAPIILAPEIRRTGLAHDHPAVTYLLGLTPGSRATQLRSLQRAANFFGSALPCVQWTELSGLEMAALRSYLAEAYAPSYGNLTLTAVRGVQRAAVRSGQMTAESFARTHVDRIRGRRVKPGRCLTAVELRSLFRVAAQLGSVGLRMRAILALGYGCGLRRDEIASLRFEHVSSRIVGATCGAVRVVGKGNDEREVPLNYGCSRALAAWIDWRGSDPGFLICGIRRYPVPGRADPASRMHTTSIYASLQRLAKRARVASFTPHDLRRTFAGDLLDAGVDLHTVQMLMGHADPVTTAGYDRRGARVLADAVARLDVPE